MTDKSKQIRINRQTEDFGRQLDEVDFDSKKPEYIPSSLVNPYGFGMALCLNAMDDCLASGDTVMYDKWLDMGLKYAKAFLKADNAVLRWRCEYGNLHNTQNSIIFAI